MTPKQYDEAMEQLINKIVATVDDIEYHGTMLQAMIKLMLKHLDGQEQDIATILKSYSVTFSEHTKELEAQADFLENLIKYL